VAIAFETGVEIHAKCVGTWELGGGGHGTKKRLVVVRIGVNVKPNTVIKMIPLRGHAYQPIYTHQHGILAPGSTQ